MNLIFTHIPKTAGTSFKKSHLSQLFNEKHFIRPNGLYSFLKARLPCESFCITGHLPYGLHYLKPFRNFYYITFLRSPVERAISHYNFVLQTKSDAFEHPDYKICSQYSIEEVYEKGLNNYSGLTPNLQTKVLAGISFRYIKNSNAMLKAAKKHLENYIFFGIKEYYEESCVKFQKIFHITPLPLERRLKATKGRKYSQATIRKLEDLHQLDLELYEYALQRFHMF